MFASTITLTINAVDKVLNRVNQDNYGSEYRLNNDTESLTLKIRHSTDSVDSDGLIMSRHNVYVEWIIYPTATDLMKKYSFTGTIRNGTFSGTTSAGDLGEAMTTWLASGTVIADLVAGVN